MGVYRLLAILLSIVFSALAQKSQVDLALWQPFAGGPRLLLPVVNGESLASAKERYLLGMSQNPRLSSFVTAESWKNQGIWSEFKYEGKQSLVALIANSQTDMNLDGERILRNVEVFAKAGGDVVVIPVSAEAGLRAKFPELISELHRLIAERVDLMVALGGENVDPRLYQDHSSAADRKGLPEGLPRILPENNYERDKSEFDLIVQFKKLSKGFFFGICRGHQMGALADGHHLDDLPQELKESHANRNGKDLTSKQQWHHIFFSPGSKFERFVKQLSIRVNSIHQQQVMVSPDAVRSVPVAFAGDGTVEALEQRNGRGFSIQGHWEFPFRVSNDREFADFSNWFLRRLVKVSRVNRRAYLMNRCGQVHLVY